MTGWARPVCALVVLGACVAQATPAARGATAAQARGAPQAPSNLQRDRRAVTTSSGLAYLVLRAGHSDRAPHDDSRVTLQFAGWTADRKPFASTADRGPVTLSVRDIARLIPGCGEAVKLMVEGETVRLWIPEPLGYKGAGLVEGPLVMEVTLLSVSEEPAAAPFPPPGAVRPAPGITYPTVVDNVKPRYTSDAMRARIQGTVVMEGVVQPDGTMTDLRITRSLDPILGLDDEALKAARQYRFRAGTRDGTAIPVAITVEMSFTLR
jgi:TonB family protein